jgi:hypothetical protein
MVVKLLTTLCIKSRNLDNTGEKMKILGWTVTVAFIILVNIFWSGYVIMMLWNWFISPAFQVSHISLPLALGVSTFITYFSANPTDHDFDGKKSIEILLYMCGWVIIKPGLALLCGWIITLFM